MRILENLLLRLWYPVTVATISWHVKQTIRQFLERTSDNTDAPLPFKLHDLGARGVSSAESAALGGCANLVNFLDTQKFALKCSAARVDGRCRRKPRPWPKPRSRWASTTRWSRCGRTAG